MRDVVIVSGARTPMGRGKKGTLKDTRPDELASMILKEAINRADNLKASDVDDVILGCAFPEAEQGMNIAKIAAFRAGIPNSVPAMTINRFCSSGLQAVAMAAERIMCGFADVIVAGGIESMSQIPMGGLKPTPNPWLLENYPESYTPMGTTAEIVAERFNISREQQDEFAYKSHMKAAKAIENGVFKDEILPVKAIVKSQDPKGGAKDKEVLFENDECVRTDTTLEGLAKLKPVFDLTGTVTAGNSSPTNDGSAAVVLMSKERADELGIKSFAYFRRYEVIGVEPEIMGIGPALAIPKLLNNTGYKIEDIDLFEVNEAFASQSVYCQNELNIPDEKINVNGGAIALGHPLGCTGCKLLISLMYEMRRSNKKLGVVSMCIGGGMGAAGLIELVE